MPERATVLVDGDVMAKEDLLVAAYKHVFGNAYVMESERAALGKAESDFKGNTMSVRELVRAMAKSEAYRSRFFSRSGAYRFVELNCKVSLRKQAARYYSELTNGAASTRAWTGVARRGIISCAKSDE